LLAAGISVEYIVSVILTVLVFEAGYRQLYDWVMVAAQDITVFCTTNHI
jgi:hypothetical protein